MTITLVKASKRKLYDPLEGICREVDRTLAELGDPSPVIVERCDGMKLDRITGVEALDRCLASTGVTRISGGGSIPAMVQLIEAAIRDNNRRGNPCIIVGRMARILPILESLNISNGTSEEALGRLTLYDVKEAEELLKVLHRASQEAWQTEHSHTLIVFESLASILSPFEFAVHKSTRRLVDVVYRQIAALEASVPCATVVIREPHIPSRAWLSLTGPTKDVHLQVTS
ncbi:hypothetical protein FOL47_001719 [Perkinsus chesapeaki]|uniref:DNA recombination and repair protein Rad51-like C-terminal domain-containing protein n=1 Tax=Perkinsus chesapeaki TaxID=330153 RepID=A0A7J6MHU2_PERCH|nr:hypothetical protein FOL47_001719 [Perkinsus chesapeaki]